MYFLDTSIEGGKHIFGASENPEIGGGAITVNCHIDNGSFDQSAVTILDPLGHQPVIFFERRVAPNAGTNGLWRHFTVAIDNAAGRRPIFKVSRIYRDDKAVLNLSMWRGVWTQDFNTWTQSETPVLDGGYNGTFNWQFTDPLPAGVVYVAHNVYGRQQEADAFAQYLFVNHPSIATPADPSYTGGVYARSITENGDLGTPVGNHPRYAIKLQWPDATTDGKRKRKAVLMTGIHSAGEGQCWWAFYHAVMWLINSSDTEAANLRANFDWYLYFNVNPNGMQAGTSRLTPRSGTDPNRTWSPLANVSAIEEVDTLKRVIYANVGGQADLQISYHGNTSQTTTFDVWLWGPDISVSTRSEVTKRFLVNGQTIFGVAPTVTGIDNNTIDIWFGRQILKAPASFNCEVPSMSGSTTEYFGEIGKNWLKTAESVDREGLIIQELKVSTTPASFGFSPINAAINSFGLLEIPATPAPLGLVGVKASVETTWVLVVRTAPATIALSGSSATIITIGNTVILTNAASVGLRSVNATLNITGVLKLATVPVVIGLTGVQASLSITGSISIQAKPAIISLSGVNAGIDLDSGSVNFGTANTSRYFLSDAMSGMDLSGDFSIVAVISPDYTVSNRHKYFFSTAASSSDPNGLNLYITSNDGFLSLLPGNGSSAVSSAPVPPGWCLVYARRIAGVLSVGFVDLSNGTHTKSNTPSSSGNFSNNVAVIGGRFDLDATRFYTGGMSWIALLETGLSDGQIESIAAGTIGLLNDFEPSIVELWDMTYNRLIQPGVVNGINAQRFGDGWGAGGDNPLPYELPESLVIEAIPAIFGLVGVKATIDAKGQLVIGAEVASLGLRGVPASVEVSGTLTIRTDAADIGLSGVKSTIVTSGTLTIGTAPAVFALTGVKATVKADGKLVIDAKASTIGLQGLRAGVNGNISISMIPAVFGILGQKSDISMRTALAANPASMILASMRAQINYESPIVWGSTTIEARLQGMTIEARQ